MSIRNLVLRTVYIDPDVDDRLRDEAFAKNTSKNDLIRKYLQAGMTLDPLTISRSSKKSQSMESPVAKRPATSAAKKSAAKPLAKSAKAKMKVSPRA